MCSSSSEREEVSDMLPNTYNNHQRTAEHFLNALLVIVKGFHALWRDSRDL